MVSGLFGFFFFFGGVFFSSQREPAKSATSAKLPLATSAKLPGRADPAANPSAFICARLGSGACSRLFPEEKKGSHTKISH